MSYDPITLAEAYISAGELADALRELDAHLDASPGDDAGRRLRAAVRLRLDDARGALTDLDALATPDDADHLGRSRALEQLGDPAAAAAALSPIARPDARIIERQLTLLRAAGDLNAARRLLDAQPADHWRWHTWRGDLAAPADAPRHYTSALNALIAAPALPDAIAAPLRAEILLKRAEAYLALNHLDEAAADTAAAAELVADDPMIAFQAGRIRFRQGDASAVEACKAAYARAPAALQASMREALAHPDDAALAQSLQFLY